MYVLFTVMSVFFFFFSFPIFKDTIYIRVPQRTDPFNVHTAFAVLEPV